MTELHIWVESLLDIKLIGEGWEGERKEGRKKREGGVQFTEAGPVQTEWKEPEHSPWDPDL